VLINYCFRPVHVFIIATCPYVAHLLKTTIQEDSQRSSIIFVQQICYVVLPCLPLIWFFGLLPSLEPLFFWMIEQIQIFIFGGSASASPIRSIFYIILSALAFIILLLGSADLFSALIWACAFGYILSLDWFNLLETLSKWTFSRIKRCGGHDSSTSNHNRVIKELSENNQESLNG